MSDLHAALVAALKDLTVVEKGRTADTGKYSYDYASIEDVVRATRPALATHGLVALTPLTNVNGQPAVEVHLVHTSGEQLVLGPFPFDAGRDPQATGSAVTYMRRYALLAALGMAAGDDDDGAKASESARRPAQRDDAPSEAQVTWAKKLAYDLGDAAPTVVPSIVEEVTGRQAKLVDLTRSEISAVIEELKSATADPVAKREAEATARANAGQEPFLEGDGNYDDGSVA